MTWKVPLFRTYWDENDVESVTRIIKRGSYWAIGPEIKEFESRVAEFIGTKYAIAFNSGTSALHTLLLAHGIEKKEVIVPSFTFAATANTVILAGGVPVFAESESETFSLDIEDVKKKINEKTAAVITIQYAGFPGRDTIELRKLCDAKGILFIEDAAQSFGSHIEGEKVGSFGHSAIFSLCQDKTLTTGEGGLITTDDKEVYEKSLLIRSHGRLDDKADYFGSIKEFEYVIPGYNFRMPTVLAALGISQLEKIDKIIELRRNVAKLYTEELSGIEGLKLPKETKGHFWIYQKYPLLLDEGKRDELQSHLANNGIMSRIYFPPLHLKKYYVDQCGYKVGDLPFTEKLSKRVLNIPIFPDLKVEEQKYIIKSIKEYF